MKIRQYTDSSSTKDINRYLLQDEFITGVTQYYLILHIVQMAMLMGDICNVAQNYHFLL